MSLRGENITPLKSSQPRGSPAQTPYSSEMQCRKIVTLKIQHDRNGALPEPGSEVFQSDIFSPKPGEYLGGGGMIQVSESSAPFHIPIPVFEDDMNSRVLFKIG